MPWGHGSTLLARAPATQMALGRFVACNPPRATATACTIRTSKASPWATRHQAQDGMPGQLCTTVVATTSQTRRAASQRATLPRGIGSEHTQSTCDDVTGAMYPSPGSERRLARVSRTSCGALSHIRTRGVSLRGSRLRAPTCLELPTHGALSQFGLVGTAQHRLRTHYKSRTDALVCARYGGRLPVLVYALARRTKTQWLNVIS